MHTTDKYILDGKTPVPIYDLHKWVKWCQKNSRIVKRTKLLDVLVSTVFLGMDHQFGQGEPILFETMIFGGDHDEFQERYSTWEQAEAGHEAAVKKVKKSK